MAGTCHLRERRRPRTAPADTTPKLGPNAPSTMFAATATDNARNHLPRVVALGRDVWAAVRSTPVLLIGDWPTDLGRSLEEASVDAVRFSVRTQIDTVARSTRSSTDSVD